MTGLLLLMFMFTHVFLVRGVSDASEVVEIEISRSAFDPIPVAVFPFQVGEEARALGYSIEDVLKADLTRSQLFRIESVDGIAGISGRSPASGVVQQASAKGAHVSVWGKLFRQGDEFVLDVLLYEGEAGRTALRKKYKGGVAGGSKNVVRDMVHRLSNLIIQRYSGQRGVAGTQIVFVAEVDGGKQLYVMDYDGYRLRPLTNNPFLNLFPRWSPQKRFLAFTSYRDANPDIHVMDLKEGKRRTLVAFRGANITPAWSPDGKQLAFSSSFDGDADIYTVQAADGTQLRQLTVHPASDFAPTWAPSGMEIAFSSDRGGSLQIYVMDADGSNVRRLTFKGRYNTAPSWSPDGRWIAYTCKNSKGSLRICRVTPDGRHAVQVTRGKGDHESASWSPDSRNIAFSATEYGTSHIYSVRGDGSGLEQLTSGPMRTSSPAWSPWPE